MPLPACFAEVEAFTELIHYIYHKALTRNAKELGADTVLTLFTLADRFQVESCLSFCTKALAESGQPGPELAVRLISLPQALVSRRQLLPAVHLAKDTLVKEFGEMFKASGHPSERLLGLPEAAFTALLEADEIDAPSEDTVLDVALQWATCQSQHRKEHLRLLGETILPRIRLAFLSGSGVRQVVSTTMKCLHSLRSSPSPITCPQGQPSHRSSHDCPCWLHGKNRGPTPKAQGIVADHITFCLKSIVQAGVVPSLSLLEASVLDMSKQVPRGPGNRKADAIFHFDIPYHNHSFVASHGGEHAATAVSAIWGGDRYALVQSSVVPDVRSRVRE